MATARVLTPGPAEAKTSSGLKRQEACWLKGASWGALPGRHGSAESERNSVSSLPLDRQRLLRAAQQAAAGEEPGSLGGA